MTSKIEEYKKMLAQLQQMEQSIKQQIMEETELNGPYKTLLSFVSMELNNPEDTIRDRYRDEYKKKLLYSKTYQMITLTFAPSVSVKLTEKGQQQCLTYIIKAFKEYHYFACLEKHKTGILHAHILVVCDPYKVRDILTRHCSKLNGTQKFGAAIKVVLVKGTETDIVRTYNYIWDDKPDHPKYKDILINI